MHQVTSDYAQTHFNEILEHANQNSEGVVIIQESKHFILMPQDLLESFIETNQLLKDPNLLTDVQQAQEEYLKSDVIRMEQIFG